MANESADFPHKLGFLFYPERYKIAYGGRGSGKSWSFARALLIQGLQSSIRVLCTREVQKSIKDSVHKLLSDQIQLLGLGALYTVLETTIRSNTNKTEFMFSGLSTHTVESIKSFEGCDVCWIEEAQTVGKRSWDILIPTIRKNDSEIWISFNPDLETDETYQRFVVNAPPGSYSVEVNYRDNPWFNDVMNKERLHCKETDPENYQNIWGGKCRPAVEGAIFYKEIVAANAEGRIRNVPVDPLLKCHVVFDLGHADNMAVIVVQKLASEIRIVDYIEDNRKTLAYYSTKLKEKAYNWGNVYLPHDGKHADYKTGKTAQEIMQALGWRVLITPQIGIENGIKNARLTFSRIFFDKTKTERLVECLKHYRRKINRITEAESTPLHDEYSDGADCFRYLCVNVDEMTNDESEKPFAPTMQHYAPLDAVIGM